MSLILCKECGKEISDQATKCPNCGCPLEKSETSGNGTIPTQHTESKNKGKKTMSIFALLFGILSFIPGIGVIFIVAALVVSIICLAKKKAGKGLAIAGLVLGIFGVIVFGASGSDSNKEVQNVTKTEEKQTEASTASDETEEPSTDDNVPREYKSALKKAEAYSNKMYLSKQGVYNQLTSEYGEKFPADAAQYAIDNVVADWNENALQKAKSYQQMDMSTSAIYDQLISEYGELFEESEAQYAIDNLDK